MAMTITDMVTFVRTHADADATDAPDTLLFTYARMAYTDILSRNVAWPHLFTNYSFNTAASQADYAFSSIGAGTLDRVVEVLDQSQSGWSLTYLTSADGDLLYGSPTPPYSNQPAAYSVAGNSSLTIYPTPNGIKTLVVRGYRNAAEWPTVAGSLPDLPSGFDEAICMFMLSFYFTSQEDPGLAELYMQRYEMIVQRQLRVETTRNALPRPSVLPRKPSNWAGPSWWDRVRGMTE